MATAPFPNVPGILPCQRPLLFASSPHNGGLWITRCIMLRVGRGIPAFDFDQAKHGATVTGLHPGPVTQITDKQRPFVVSGHAQ